MLVFGRSLCLSPDAPPAAAPPAVPPVSAERKADDFTTRMIAQHGTVENALRATAMRLFTAEDSAAGLTSQVDQYKAKLPEGAIVLTKEAAAGWAKLQDLKLTPDQIIERVSKYPTLESSIAERDAEQLHRKAAPLAGLDPDAFADHAKTKKLHVELKPVTVVENGKSVTKEVPHVRPAADDKAPLVAASEYVGKLPAHEQRSLKPGPAATTPVGTPYPESRPTQTSESGKADVQSLLKSVNEKFPTPSEMRKQTQKQGA